MACDMCGKKGVELEPLKDKYKTKDIQNICEECLKLVNNKAQKMRVVADGMVMTLVKRFMTNRMNDR